MVSFTKSRAACGVAATTDKPVSTPPPFRFERKV
jgi:hypothetical protein